MSEYQIKRFDKVEEDTKQLTKEYLLAYLNKVEEESDELESIIEKLEKVILDEAELEKKQLVGVLLSEKRKK